MKKLILSLILSLTSLAHAGETITVHFSASASQPNAAPYLKMLEVANKLQNKYDFVLEFKPGANGVLAIKAMDTSPTNRLATIAPAFVENSKQGLINENDYVPVATQGDACWAIITNVGDTKQGLASLKGQREITVGGTGYGNAAHITALMIGEQYGFKVRYVVYKANYEALLNMASGEPINFVIERVANYNTFKAKNPKMQVLGINCASRNPLMPEVKTVREQGFNAPTIFMATVANKRMPEEKRKEIASILDKAQGQLGKEYLLDSSDMNPPQFNQPKITTEEFFATKVIQMKALTHRYEAKINEAR
jgi:tripartite-type tricarboxylate transporter receptor subunit TctC